MEDKQISKFSGQDSAWVEWSFEARSEIVCRGILSDDQLIKIEAMTEPCDAGNADLKERASRLYHLLARSCKGAANLILRKIPRGNGFEAWRQLHQRYDRIDADSSMSVLACILSFDFGTEIAKLEDRLNQFDVLVYTYSSANPTEEISEAVIKAILLQHLPEPLRSQLSLQVTAQTTLAVTRSKIDDYLRSHREFRQSFVVPDASQSSATETNGDVHALQGKFKGKGFGKGKGFSKGKGKGKGKDMFKPILRDDPWSHDDEDDDAGWYTQCWMCGGWGHKERHCANNFRTSIQGIEGHKSYTENSHAASNVWGRGHA